MGTRTKPRHRRRSSKRGLASFVSFFLLFAVALGQTALTAHAGAAPDTPGPPSGDGEQPTLLSGNQNCAEVAEFLFEYRDNSPGDDTVDLAAESDGAITGTLTIDVHTGGTFDFSITGGSVALAVVVKGGSNANLFDYRPAGNAADTALHAPVNPNNGTFYGLSHISFCFGGQFTEPGIDVTKSCPESVPFGSDIQYTITVENTGDEPLVGISVKDTLLGDITGEFDFDFANPFPVDGLATAVVTYTPQPGDPDPIINTVHVVGFGQGSGGVKVTDNATCTTDLTQEPSIDVTKSCPETVPAGSDIEYTITVENTGNEALEGVTVTDTLLGDITGEFDVDFANPFPVGGFATAVVTYSPGADEDPVLNTVTATGTGADSGVEASDEASCTTDITHEPGIDVTKSCPETVPAGSDIEYTITVENTGNEALEGVTVTDTLLGDITGEFDVDFANPFPVGGFATAVVTYSPGADEDTVLNTVTATGTGADSGVEASDEASCTTDVENPNPAISVEKSCIELAHVGDTVTYTITVTNTGDEDLDGVTVTDTILGDLSTFFADELAVDASESHEFAYVVLESDPDPLVNEVTVSGAGAESDVAVDDLANCSTDLIHPGIEIVKTVDDGTVPIGTTVTFTYVVTNTGDTTLYDISVDDDILGHIGDIEVLEPGQSVTLTADFVVGDEPVINVGTAEGEDILGRSVSATDNAVVTPIADVNPDDPTPPPTPFTGSDASLLGLIAMALLGLGAALVAVTRRRRTEDGTA